MSGTVMTVGIVGCGIISEIYMKNMTERFKNLRVKSCCDLQEDRAKKRAETFGLQISTYEDIISDPEIDIVVILTPAPTHYNLVRGALLAGKHVYTEKTMALNVAQATELIQIADKKGLWLGAAPDTFMGSAFQLARKVVDSGELGQITSFQICANRNLDWLTTYYPFLCLPGGGICYDYGVYHLTALISLLGPVADVCATVENHKKIRTNCNPASSDFGKPYRYENEAQVTAIIRTESGITGSFTLNGESIGADLCVFMLYGTKGVLKLPDPNGFGGDVVLIRNLKDQKVLENSYPFFENSRGLGPADMAEAIAAGKRNRANKEQALHVLDVIQSMIESNEKKTFVKVQSTCERPDPLGTAM